MITIYEDSNAFSNVFEAALAAFKAKDGESIGISYDQMIFLYKTRDELPQICKKVDAKSSSEWVAHNGFPIVAEATKGAKNEAQQKKTADAQDEHMTESVVDTLIDMQ